MMSIPRSSYAFTMTPRSGSADFESTGARGCGLVCEAGLPLIALFKILGQGLNSDSNLHFLLNFTRSAEPRCEIVTRACYPRIGSLARQTEPI